MHTAEVLVPEPRMSEITIETRKNMNDNVLNKSRKNCFKQEEYVMF
jgi:hypothetical protein